MDRVEECIYHHRNDCRGCEQSINPALFDGGCMLHYAKAGGGLISTREAAQNRTTTPREFSQNSKGKAENF